MIGTACFYILPVVGDRTFFLKRSRAFKKKITAFLKKEQELFLKNVLIFFTPAENSIVSLIS